MLQLQSRRQSQSPHGGQAIENGVSAHATAFGVRASIAIDLPPLELEIVSWLDSGPQSPLGNMPVRRFL